MTTREAESSLTQATNLQAKPNESRGRLSLPPYTHSGMFWGSVGRQAQVPQGHPPGRPPTSPCTSSLRRLPSCVRLCAAPSARTSAPGLPRGPLPAPLRGPGRKRSHWTSRAESTFGHRPFDPPAPGTEFPFWGQTSNTGETLILGRRLRESQGDVTLQQNEGGTPVGDTDELTGPSPRTASERAHVTPRPFWKAQTQVKRSNGAVRVWPPRHTATNAGAPPRSAGRQLGRDRTQPHAARQQTLQQMRVVHNVTRGIKQVVRGPAMRPP